MEHDTDTRHSSISVRSSSIETTVTKLLMSTKHLLQVLTQWSKGTTSGKGVSDAYVQLGNDFKLVSKHFVHHGIDVTDLGNVPLVLRKVLELALREKPSDETLNKYLPQIREIIVNLLDKLKVKQNKLKELKKNQQHLKNDSISTNEISLSSPIQAPRYSPNSTLNKNDVAISNSTKDNDNNLKIGDKRSSDANSSIASLQDSSINKSSSADNIAAENDPMSQLKVKHVQRRASKRYSAYHMAKLTNQSASDAMAASALPKSQISDDMKEPETTDAVKNGVIPSIETPSQKHLEEREIENDTSNDLKVSNKPTDHVTNSQLINEANDDHNITLFLRYKGRTKKCITPKISSINNLRLFFVEKFAYSPGSTSFPNLYIMDPKFSILYELEEHNLSDIHDGSLIQLDLETNFKTSDNAVSEIGTKLEEVILKAQNEILETLKNKLGHASVDESVHRKETKSEESTPQNNVTSSSVDMKHLRYQLDLLKKSYQSNKLQTEDHLEAIATKITNFKMSAIETNFNINDSYIEKSQNELGNIADSLLTKVDDLQDIIEILRKDVADRGAKPPKKKLESLLKEIKEAETDLNTMQKFMTTEKPTWKKLWESQLDKVCEEQQFLTLQEDLIEDLKDDLSRTNETFELIKLCCEEKEKNPIKTTANTPFLPLLKPGTFNEVREQMLLDVQSLNPNHEGRLDALEKAEKLWEKEKKYKNEDAFKDELGNFVENSHLKKSGGVEELDRLRRYKDEENLRNNFRRQP